MYSSHTHKDNVAHKPRMSEAAREGLPSYLSAPAPRRNLRQPRRCRSGARPPQTAGSPPPGCPMGAGRRRFWKR